VTTVALPDDDDHVFVGTVACVSVAALLQRCSCNPAIGAADVGVKFPEA